jgi:NADH-quinone oxidoreductase subunit A
MNPGNLWPVLVYAAAVLVLVGGMLGVPYVLGERHKQKTTGEPYESGMPPTGSARFRFDVRFYMMAMFFVIFDLETAFLFAWAIAFRELGWLGYAEAVIFIAILVVALVYLWRVGGLDWGPRRSHR